ncbi:MAG: thiamine-phosphate kinase [Bacteroidota bacterium]
MTPIEHVGEFGLIDRITKNFESYHANVQLGIGDDAAIVKTGSNTVELISTDLLLEGVHFDLAYAPIQHVGFKSIAVNVSDIVAMNAQPYGVTVSIGVSNRFTVEAIEELYAGIQAACDAYQIDLLGGDTSSSRQGLVISVTAFGTAQESEVVRRKGAQVKNLVCVSGDLGSAYAGFLILDREKSVFLKNPQLQPDLNDFDYVVGRQLRPRARLDLIQRLAALNVKPTSMIDVSDGLANEIHHLCKHSNCGARLFANKLPLDFQTMKVGEEFQISPVTFALHGGEDYELLFTIPIEDFDKIKTEADISVIGHITEDPQVIQMVLDSGELTDIHPQGWNHFQQSESE